MSKLLTTTLAVLTATATLGEAAKTATTTYYNDSKCTVAHDGHSTESFIENTCIEFELAYALEDMAGASQNFSGTPTDHNESSKVTCNSSTATLSTFAYGNNNCSGEAAPVESNLSQCANSSAHSDYFEKTECLDGVVTTTFYNDSECTTTDGVGPGAYNVTENTCNTPADEHGGHDELNQTLTQMKFSVQVTCNATTAMAHQFPNSNCSGTGETEQQVLGVCEAVDGVDDLYQKVECTVANETTPVNGTEPTAPSNTNAPSSGSSPKVKVTATMSGAITGDFSVVLATEEGTKKVAEGLAKDIKAGLQNKTASSSRRETSETAEDAEWEVEVMNLVANGTQEMRFDANITKYVATSGVPTTEMQDTIAADVRNEVMLFASNDVGSLELTSLASAYKAVSGNDAPDFKIADTKVDEKVTTTVVMPTPQVDPTPGPGVVTTGPLDGELSDTSGVRGMAVMGGPLVMLVTAMCLLV